MASLAQLQKQRDALSTSTKELDEQIAEAKRRKLLKCDGCGKRTRIGSITYIQTYWYERPYGCTGGDNWLPGEGQWKCPKCDHKHRLLKSWNRDKNGNRPEHPTTYLKHYFKEIVKSYDRH